MAGGSAASRAGTINRAAIVLLVRIGIRLPMPVIGHERTL
jgi:hypothetical protein